MKNWTAFRSWVFQVYTRNVDEHQEFGELPFSTQEYFQRYKYWLKREYTHQLKVNHDQEVKN
jgi:hypothetical protein